MKDLLKKFIFDDSGLETVEYAIITGLIVAGTIVAIGTLGTWVGDTFTSVNTKLPAVK